MTYTTLIRIGPVLTAERWDDPRWCRPDRTLYWPGALRLIPRRPTPIVRDHDTDDVIGTVTELVSMPFSDGGWIVARGVIDDPPDWLRQYRTKASVGYWDVHSSPHINGSKRITSGIVQGGRGSASTAGRRDACDRCERRLGLYEETKCDNPWPRCMEADHPVGRARHASFRRRPVRRIPQRDPIGARTPEPEEE